MLGPGHAQQRTVEKRRRSRSDGEIADVERVGREAGCRNPLQQTADGDRQPGGTAGVGRRIIRQRSSGTPSDGGSTRNQPSSWGPKSSTPHTSAQPSPHQRATAAASSSSRQLPSGNTSRTWAARPDRVSRASTGPAGREAIPAELAR